MEPYSTPVLRDLGRMDAVTRKSGPSNDFASEDGRVEGDLQQWCDVFPFLPWCNGTNGAANSASF